MDILRPGGEPHVWKTREAQVVRVVVDPTNPDYVAMSRLIDDVLLDSDMELLKKLAE